MPKCKMYLFSNSSASSTVGELRSAIVSGPPGCLIPEKSTRKRAWEENEQGRTWGMIQARSFGPATI